MKLIVGLGNYGEKYTNTRHNVGFIILEHLAQTHNTQFKDEKKFKGQVAELELNGEKTLLLKPLTFMNLSGESVRLVADFYKINTKDITVIHDDLDFEVGVVKTQFARSSAGHNGVQSIIDNLGTNEFNRVRVGIGKPENEEEKENYVLRKLSKEELESIKYLVSGI